MKKNSANEMRIWKLQAIILKDQKLVVKYVSYPLWKAVKYGALWVEIMELSSSTKEHYT